MNNHPTLFFLERPRSHRCSRGFTLVEILVSVVILSIGVLTVSQMTVMGMRTNQLVKRHMEARSVLAKGLEAIKLMNGTDPYLYDNCDGDTTLLDSTNGAYSAHEFNAVGQMIGKTSYDVYWNVIDNYPLPQVKTIRMLVYKNNERYMKADYVKWGR